MAWIDDQPVEVRVWFASLPVVVQEMVLKYKPGKKFLMASTGHVCRIFSYQESEDEEGRPTCDKCGVAILQEDNGGKLHQERRVFDVELKDLVPCPEGWEATGDRPLEELPEGLRGKIEELAKAETN